jgi:hypothetical protein
VGDPLSASGLDTSQSIRSVFAEYVLKGASGLVIGLLSVLSGANVRLSDVLAGTAILVAGFMYLDTTKIVIVQLSPRQLKVIGLLLTFVGIVTPVLSPFLDLFNSKVV